MLIFIAVVSSTVLSLFIRLCASTYTYNPSSLLLIVESLKLVTCYVGMRWICDKSYFQVRWGFLVNAFLYAAVNTLTHFINKEVPAALYNALTQHRLLWVVVFSVIILNKKLDILKSELHTKGFPFEFDKEFIQEQIKESLLNKILFMKDEMNEHSLHDQLEDIAKKTFSKNFSLKPELLIHLSIV